MKNQLIYIGYISITYQKEGVTMHSPEHNFLLSFIISLIISGFTAYYAEKKGRNPFAWFVIALFISFLAPIILYFLPPLKDQKNEVADLSIEKATTPVLVVTPSKSIEEMPSGEKLWHYLDENHTQYGPVSIIALKELFDKGKLGLNSYVWSAGMEKWEKVNDLEDLKEALHRLHPLL
jgi:hypothetical protein